MGNQVLFAVQRGADVQQVRADLTSRVHCLYPLFENGSFVSHYQHANSSVLTALSKDMAFAESAWGCDPYNTKEQRQATILELLQTFRKNHRMRTQPPTKPTMQPATEIGTDYFVFGFLTDFTDSLNRDDNLWDEMQKLVNGETSAFKQPKSEDVHEPFGQVLSYLGSYGEKQTMIAIQGGNNFFGAVFDLDRSHLGMTKADVLSLAVERQRGYDWFLQNPAENGDRFIQHCGYQLKELFDSEKVVLDIAERILFPHKFN